MTNTFRLNRVILDTVEGPVQYAFAADLTILAGPTGVGKTTLLESVKYALGGDGMLADVIRKNVNEVSVDITLGYVKRNDLLGEFTYAESQYLLTRSVDPGKQRTVRVIDLKAQERLPDHNADLDRAPSLNTLLMNSLGFDDEMRAASRTSTSTKVGTRISFADIFLFMYVAQSDMNRDVAKSQDSYYDPKRKAVFELLFGLTNERILALRSQVNRLNGEVADAAKETQTIRTFLRDSNTTSKEEALTAFRAAEEEQSAADTELNALRQEINPVTDRGTQVMRDLLNDTERRLADARATVAKLTREHADLSHEKLRVQTEHARLQRMRDAGERLANIEFVSCPRCMQPLAARPIPQDACRVCLQHDPVSGVQSQDPYEERHLIAQIQEMDDQLTAVTNQLTQVKEAASDRESLVKRLTVEIESRASARVTPRLQAYSDASQRLANAQAHQRELDTVLRQWDRVDDFAMAEADLKGERDELRTELLRLERNLDRKRQEILDDLDAEFAGTIQSLGVPSVRSAEINRKTYLPMLNGAPFHRASKGGGIITATQIAYWTSILNVVVTRGDTYYPSFLLIDSPRMALNTAEGLTSALYYRLWNLARSKPGKLQLIVADNELPRSLQGDFAEVDFDYNHPTVATIRHPGPAAVETIDKSKE